MQPLLVAGKPALTRFGIPIDITEPVMELRAAWADDLLGRFSDTPGTNSMADLVAWATAEGGGVPDPMPDGPQTNVAANNPGEHEPA